MVCITNEGLAELRANDKFNDWLQKIKKEYPDKNDEDVENTLIAFMELNNGNFPGDTPFGDRDFPIASETFEQLKKVYDGDEVTAMEVYELLLDKDFIELFGNWCNAYIDTDGLSLEEIEKRNQEDQAKLLRAMRNSLGEPALLFVNSVNLLSASTNIEATTKRDANLPFKIKIEKGEARAIIGFDRSVQSGSITFMVANNIITPLSSDDEILIDVDDVFKCYDFDSENKGFTEKRLDAFITQSSKDLYDISKLISRINGLLKAHSDIIHSKEDAISFIRGELHPKVTLGKSLIFDTDETSPFGSIKLGQISNGGKLAWQIISPEGIFRDFNRYGNNCRSTTEKSRTYVDKIADTFFVKSSWYKNIKDYIISNVLAVKPDSYLTSPIVDYDGDRFILKPASNRTQHNIKTEFGLAYAVHMFNKNLSQFEKYLNWAKQFSDIRYNSAGIESIKDVNMVGNLIGSILSGLLVDANYYTAHVFDQRVVELAIFVSKHQTAIREIVDNLQKDMQTDIKTVKMSFLNVPLINLSKIYDKIDFSNITDNVSKNRTVSKIKENLMVNSFCDSIDRVKSIYNYRRNDTGTKKTYDATEYAKVSSTYDLLDTLNKLIKEYLINHTNEEAVANGDNLERLISLYFTCVDTIVSIMDDDISSIEEFIWHTPEKYTPEYYSTLLYLDRSIIKMYINQKETMEAMFNLDSSESDIVQKSLYDIFSYSQIKKFEQLRSRYYNNYNKIANLRTGDDKKGSLLLIISTMIDDAISYVCDDWCNKNLKCLTELEEQIYRENLKLDLEGHVNAGMPLDTFIGGSASSGHSIINVLYRIILTQGNRSNLLIKQKGDYLIKKFKSTFNNNSPFNKCKQFCEMVEVKKKIAGKTVTFHRTSGYFIRDVNYGLYYRAKVAKLRELLSNIPKDENGQPYYTINEGKSTATKLIIEWGIGSDKYQNLFLDDMDRWVEQNANRRYNAQYYIDRRRILGQERVIGDSKIAVGNEAANRQNTLRRQIDGIKNRYREKIKLDNGKIVNVFLPSKVHPVQKKILDNLEHQLANLSSPYERYTDSNGVLGIREKTGLDLAIALNIQDWNKYIQDRRNYELDIDKYNEVEQKIHKRVEKDLTKKDYDEFVKYYHRTQATQEYYDTLEEMYKGGYGPYQDEIDNIRFKRRSILARVKHGKKDLFQLPNLDELTDSEWEELKNLEIREQQIKNKLPQRFNTIESITASDLVENKTTGRAFLDEHKEANKAHGYTDDDGIWHPLSVYYISFPRDEEYIEEVLVDEFSVEDSEYANKQFDAFNPSYEQPKAYEINKDGSRGKKLYKNDKYEEIQNDTKLFELYNEFLNIMLEANQMFGYAAISSNYKLPQIYEREASVYIGRGCGVANSWLYKLKRSFLIDERDFDRSYTSDMHADNTTSGKLRKRFVEMLSDPEHISTDLVYSVMAYYITACRYSDKLNVLALCELINRKIQDTKNIHEGLKTQAKNTVETFLFENTMDTSSAVAAGFEKFTEHTTGVMLKWKLKTAIKAFLDGYRLLTNVALTNKWNMSGHFLFATSKALMQTFGSIRSSVDMLDYNLSEALMSLNNVNIQSYADTNKTKFTRAYYRSGMMPMLTMIDHVTTKSIVLSVYDSIRLYTKSDNTKLFLNIDEYVNMYKKEHPKLSNKVAEKEAEKLFWKSTNLYNAYLLGKRDKEGNIIKGTENILNIKDEYANMFSSNNKENEEQWAILLTRVTGQINMMAAAINGFKPEDAKSGIIMRRWYLKPIFLIRSFLISNYNEIFKHSDTLKKLVRDTSTRNTTDYKPEAPKKSNNSTVNAINKFWATDNSIIQLLNSISSEREMYNVLTGTKDVGYSFGQVSFVRKMIEKTLIYLCSIYNKLDPEYRKISKLEKASVINSILVLSEAAVFYNMAVFIGGLLCCLLGQGSSPDDEDEWFIHWFLWTAYDVAGSMVNEIMVNDPLGDTIVDIFRNIASVITSFQQFKKSAREADLSLTFVSALLGDDEMFEDPEYGTKSSPFNLIRSGKWGGEMYGKRSLYETIQNAPWLLTPVNLGGVEYLISAPLYWGSPIPELPIANLKESFSARSAQAKASFTFNNLSPIDKSGLGTPSRSDESWEKFHTYDKKAAGAMMLNSLINYYGFLEEDILDLIRAAEQHPYSPIPSISPVDWAERQIPLGREYD